MGLNKKKLMFQIILFLTGVVCFLFLFEQLKSQNRLNNRETENMQKRNRIEIQKEHSNEEEKLMKQDEKQEQKIKEKRTSLAFVGDILFSDGVLDCYDKDGIDGILESSVAEQLSSADITIINNEFPFSNRGKKAADKQFTFRADPNRVSILNKIGVDVASIANNHTLDFGVDALLDTCETLKNAGIEYLGAGKNLEEAKEIKYRTINQRTIAFIAASRVIPVVDWNAGVDKPGLLTTYDPANVLDLIREAKNKADAVILYVHWGLERKNIPEDYQRNLGRQYIDEGADLVVGSHSHCLQGIEFYKDKPIVYSLGNFIFGTTIEKTVVLKVVIEEDGHMELSVLPCKANHFKTVLIKEKEELDNFYKFYEEISYQVSFVGETEERRVVSTH